MYGPPLKIPDKTIKINIIGIDTIESQAKPIQPASVLVWSHNNTIAVIQKIPATMIRMRCNFPRKVTISPPSSRGKKIGTSNPINALIRNKIGPTIDPIPSIPYINPKEKINNKALPMMKNDWNNHFLCAPTAKRELTSLRIWL